MEIGRSSSCANNRVSSTREIHMFYREEPTSGLCSLKCEKLRQMLLILSLIVNLHRCYADLAHSPTVRSKT
jgi:hypothetical protein